MVDDLLRVPEYFPVS